MLVKRAKEVKREEKVQKENGMAMARAILASVIIVILDHKAKERAGDSTILITTTMTLGEMIYTIVRILIMVTIGIGNGNRAMG